MTPSKKRQIGDIGEDIACRYLSRKGYSIAERNYWKPWGEIDIIAEKGDLLFFVEVKSVSRELLGTKISRETVRPEENMHSEKILRLHRAVQSYFLDRKISQERQWQLDLICVSLDFENKKAKVELFEKIVP